MSEGQKEMPDAMPVYEPPVIVELGQIACGVGNCRNGSGIAPNCLDGSYPSKNCNTGSGD